MNKAGHKVGIVQGIPDETQTGAGKLTHAAANNDDAQSPPHLFEEALIGPVEIEARFGDVAVSREQLQKLRV